MKKKTVIITTLIAAIIVAAYFIFFSGDAKTTKFSFATISKGDLNVIISSTGTIQAIKTVEVGTQVSGKIDRLLADFNTQVRKGQLLAVLDTVVLAASVRDAQASLDRAKALYEQAVAVHERNKQLFEKQFMNEVDFIASKTNVQVLLASQKSAVTALERANLNLNYAYIYAPISGTVINRPVEEGQTVAASLSSPTIFTIAEDLSSMRILTSVDESDIGQIKMGQKVQFTVQSQSGKKFDGEVMQIRLNPNVQSNVVSYVVVVKADNKDRLLLPGMTATVDFYVDFREDVLLVPNIALRFQPSDELAAEYQKNREKELANLPDSVKKQMQERGAQGGMGGGNSGGQMSFGGGFGGQNAMGGTGGGQRRRTASRVWYFDDNNKLQMSMIVPGLTDGKNTEIVRARNLKEGMKIITGVIESSAPAAASSSNPFNPTSQGGNRGPSRGF
ncbi:MAG: efflux RND transporter periplasmic adaptor subunit [Ignavibacteriae bacterium HGW-Ignavibacteriae-3]|nr:MAG: efflux RND transporter periplasmic adaptor subunit [Ignavibacteriae bacterium HGW-Ignavibacteriae-3]